MHQRNFQILTETFSTIIGDLVKNNGTSCNTRYWEDSLRKFRRASASEVDGERLINIEEKPQKPKGVAGIHCHYYVSIAKPEFVG